MVPIIPEIISFTLCNSVDTTYIFYFTHKDITYLFYFDLHDGKLSLFSFTTGLSYPRVSGLLLCSEPLPVCAPK